MNAPDTKELQKIYHALADDISLSIYRHRLLYSLLGEKSEISGLIAESHPNAAYLSCDKICFYGAGAGGNCFLQHWNYQPGRFVIDKYRKGMCVDLPIVSPDDFLKMPDCKEYLVVVTVGKVEFQREIAAELEQHGLRYLFAQYGVQYFDLPQLELKNEYFADVGALDGETAKYFLEHFENGHAYVFEPNPAQFEVMRQNLQGYPDAECFPCGAYDENTVLHFNSNMDDTGAARVTEAGETEVEMRRLDDILAGRPVTFLKMDIEGSELAALRGAERIIREQRPKLAICVYHKPEDMWEIPCFLLDCHPDYKLYLRHYAVTPYETVLYAI